MTSSGYSGTPLVKKLGIKEGFKFYVKNEPMNYFQLVQDIPVTAQLKMRLTKDLDFVHLFEKKKSDLHRDLLKTKKYIKPNGMIWVSWPKKSSKVETDITEGLIRNFALKNGLVDMKVCAVDEIWSGLKLVIPIKLRSK